MRIMTCLLLLLATSGFAADKFISAVKWESVDGGRPEPCERRVVMWELSDDGRTLYWVPLEGDPVPLRFVGSGAGPRSHAVRFYARLSSETEILVNLIGSPLGRISKVDYSLTFKRRSGENMQYGDAPPQMERCFWQLK
jgi:hypothetical protein